METRAGEQVFKDISPMETRAGEASLQGHLTDGDSCWGGVDVDPEGDPGEDDDEHGGHVDLDEEVAKVPAQDEPDLQAREGTWGQPSRILRFNLHVAEVSCRSFMPTFHEGSACRRRMPALRHVLVAPLRGCMPRDVSNL